MKKFRKDATSRELGTGLALTAVVIAAILAANVILYVLSLFVNIYISPPVPDEFLISGSTDALFADAIEDGRRVKVSFCYPEEDLKVHDTGSFVYRTAKQLEERYPGFIELEYINFITMRDSKGKLVDFSKYKSTSGIYRVSFVENKRNGNDYWSYQYYENSKLRRIVSVNLYKLKVIVLDKGLDWIEFTDEAHDLVLKYKETYDESSLERQNKTGFFRVTKRKTKTRQGFTWAYSFKENNQLNFVSSVNISTLKSKVLARGWEWIELTDEAKRLVEENSKKLQDRN